jgi:hypothetical protein
MDFRGIPQTVQEILLKFDMGDFYVTFVRSSEYQPH